MDPAGPIIGIDLGTTLSAIAFLNGFGRAEVIPNRHGEPTTPSVVLFPPGGGRPIVGREARERSADCPERVAEFVKREMGDPDWVLPVDGRDFTPPMISATVLRELLDVAEARLGERPRSAVITCPAYFGDLERQATADAGKLAGLEVLSVFNEPTAAALAYGLHHAARDERLRALVYDLGGGTFDVTVLELHGRSVRVLATAGEHRLGGKDWDDELVNYVAEEFVAEHGADPRDDLVAQQDLRNRCEAAKVALSRKPKAPVFCVYQGKNLKVDVTRQLFDELTRPLLEQTKTYVDQVLSAAALGWHELDVVLPVGGSSQMPQVRDLLETSSGRTPEAVLDPDMAIAQGAAYYAALLRARQGFEIKILAPNVGRRGGRPATLEQTPEVLGALPGRKAEEPTHALGGQVAGRDDTGPPPATFAVPSRPGAGQGPQVIGMLRGQTAAPGQAPGRLPGQAPGRLPGQQAPGRLPGQAPGGLPGQAPGGLPGQAPGGLPGQTPGALPGQAPTPEAAPGALRGRTARPAAPLPGAPGALPELPPGQPPPAPPSAAPPPPGAPQALPGSAPAQPPAVDDWDPFSDEPPPPGFEIQEPAGPPQPVAPQQPQQPPWANQASGEWVPGDRPGEWLPDPFAGEPDWNAFEQYDFSDAFGAPPPGAGQRGPSVVNVNSRALGVLVYRDGQPRTSVMIGQNSPLPAQRRNRFVTINDDQTAVKVVVLEGSDPDPEECVRIGECVISGLPPRPKGQQVEICYSYDADGRIHIHAMDVATKQQAQVTLHRPSALSASEVSRLSGLI